ncbi:hypothetical protein O181_057470 [Austropuccinia psidii MF-1]|uniref:Uncharacterized protein n=1 Tax=Austropuccinia psidii MF-1 TaxID=1389203 RepID=A0A9Q3E7Z2_9BASI|nr:hypothetical protein [Austropuccinia psidii MF-1]
MGPEKAEDLQRGWKPMSFKGNVKQIKAGFKNQSILSEDKKKKLANGKSKSPVESPQDSISEKQGQESLKEQSEGQEKGKVQMAQALPTELQNYKERTESHGQCIKYGKNLDGIKR